MTNVSNTNKTVGLKVRTDDHRLIEIPYEAETADPNIVYYFRPEATAIQTNRLWLSDAGVDQLNDQLVLPDTLLGQAEIFGSEFLADMNDLRQEHPAIFYGGLLLLTGALVVLFVPTLSGLAILGTPITAGLAVKGTLFGLGGFAVYNSAHHYFNLNQLQPTTPLSQYHIGREKIVEAGTGITAVAGLAILSAETLHMISAARTAQMAQAAETTPMLTSSWRSILIGCASYCHPDEMALIFANSEKTAHTLAEQTGYLCQYDGELNQWACVEGSEVDLDQLDVIDSDNYSIVLPQYSAEQPTASPTEAE